MDQPSKENINLVRLLNRLERNPRLIQTPKKAGMDVRLAHDTTDEGLAQLSRFGAEDTSNRYWELKALETTIRHARAVLETIHSSPAALQSGPQILEPSELRNKLDRIRERIDAALKTCPAPAMTRLPRTRPSTLISEIQRPEAPCIPPGKTHGPEPSEEETTGSASGKEEEEEEPESEPAEEEGRRRVGASSGGPKETSRHDEMTDELSQMAHQLKKNVHHFNKLLSEDHAVLMANQSMLELNADRMGKEAGRLGMVSLKSRSLTWFSILAVAVVAVSWILMFIIIRLS